MLRLAIGGGEGEALSLEGDVMSAIAPRAFAPGTRVALAASIESDSIALEGKTLSSKKRDDGRFDLRVRLFNIRREDRERIAAALRSS